MNNKKLGSQDIIHKKYLKKFNILLLYFIFSL